MSEIKNMYVPEQYWKIEGTTLRGIAKLLCDVVGYNCIWILSPVEESWTINLHNKTITQAFDMICDATIIGISYVIRDEDRSVVFYPQYYDVLKKYIEPASK